MCLRFRKLIYSVTDEESAQVLRTQRIDTRRLLENAESLSKRAPDTRLDAEIADSLFTVQGALADLEGLKEDVHIARYL